MFRKLPDQKKINNSNNKTNNNYSGNSYKNDNNNEFVYIDNVNQVLDLRRLSIDTNTTASGIRINNINNQYQNMKYNGEPSINYGSYSSYSMQMNYPNGYDNNTINSYDMNDSYTNGYNNANGYSTNGYSSSNAYSNANGAIVNENKENTISEWILYNNRQEYYNRVDSNQNFNEYQSNDGKYYNYSNYTSSNMNNYMKNNFQQIPNSGIQYSGIVSERQSIPYYETMPIPIYTSNTIENNDDSLGDQQAIYDDNASTIQEKYTLTSKPETSYSMTNSILTSSNGYLYNKNNNSTGYYPNSESKPLTIITNSNNNDDDANYETYSARVNGSKPLLSSYSSSSNYLSNSYSNSPYTTNMEHKKRVSISSRSSTSQNYPMVVTTSLQSNLNSRHPYSLVIEGSATSPLSRQKYNYDYQYQRSVPSTSYYDGTANDSNSDNNDTHETDSNSNSSSSSTKDGNETSNNEKEKDKLSNNETKNESNNNDASINE